MYKRNDMTRDRHHTDYIMYYEEMSKKDWAFIRSEVGDLGRRVKCGSRAYMTETGKRRSKPLYTYTNFCCGFDIETSTAHTCNLITGIKDFYSCMYVAQYSIKGEGINKSCIGIRFRSWEHVREFFIKLPKLWALGKSDVILTYVHNLDYETSYIKHRVNIDCNTFFGKSRQRPIKYLAEQHIFLHDSYSMTNMSLGKLAETYQTKHIKTIHDIDHTRPRNNTTPLTRQEERYIFNDVFILSDFAERIYSMYDFIPDTATQILSHQIQDSAIEHGAEFVGAERWQRWCESVDSSYDLLKRLHGYIFGYKYKINGMQHKVSGIVDPDMFTPYDSLGIPPPPQGMVDNGHMIYDFYQWLYRGGIAKSNARYTSLPDYMEYGVQCAVDGWDYVSSYPFVMTAFNYPVGRFEDYTGNIDELHLEYDHPDFENWRYIFILELFDVKSTDDYCIESKSKVMGDNIIEDNGRVYSADRMVCCLTDCDYALYKKYYTWDRDRSRVIRAWRARAGKLPDYLLIPLWEAGRKKQELKHVAGKETDYLLNKIAFNTFYGLCCKQPVYNNYIFDNEITDTGYTSLEIDTQVFFGKMYVSEHTVDTHVENIHYPEESEDVERQTFEECVKSFILSPYWGIWTSAFARFNLLTIIKRVSDDSDSFKVGKRIVHTNDTVYCDTDSLYFIHPERHRHIIQAWNDWVGIRVLGRLPEAYRASLSTLGQFDNIALDESHGYSDHFINFKTLGSKRYIKELQCKKRKKIKATVAGLPKGSLERFCKRNKLDIWLEFKNLLDFTLSSDDLDEQDKVKLGRKYHDERMEFFVAGEKMTEYSSCTLYPTGFTLTMAPLYLAHLEYILQEVNGGKNGDYSIYRQ